MRVLYYLNGARTRLCLKFRGESARRKYKERRALSAETSNHTLIPALLNLLRRRNSRPRRASVPERRPARLLSARKQRSPFAKSLHQAAPPMPWVTVHDEMVCTPFGIRDTINDTAESAKLRSISVSW